MTTARDTSTSINLTTTLLFSIKDAKIKDKCRKYATSRSESKIDYHKSLLMIKVNNDFTHLLFISQFISMQMLTGSFKINLSQNSSSYSNNHYLLGEPLLLALIL